MYTFFWRRRSAWRKRRSFIHIHVASLSVVLPSFTTTVQSMVFVFGFVFGYRVPGMSCASASVRQAHTCVQQRVSGCVSGFVCMSSSKCDEPKSNHFIHQVSRASVSSEKCNAPNDIRNHFIHHMSGAPPSTTWSPSSRSPREARVALGVRRVHREDTHHVRARAHPQRRRVRRVPHAGPAGSCPSIRSVTVSIPLPQSYCQESYGVGSRLRAAALHSGKEGKVDHGAMSQGAGT
jgi:hypothetical protein